jgi:GNAT superfamily N-acetyltransferase
MNELTIRRTEAADADTLIDLITALAHFEELTPPDEGARARLIEHGFGERPKYEAWLAEWEGTPVGYAFLFETYSTFLARPTLYLEDLFVLPDFRGRGIGKALLAHCVRLADERGCGRMEWTCLDWNKRAQAVYEGLGARHMSEWFLYRLTQDEIKRLASE